MKLKRSEFSMYLGFILLFTMFFACTFAFLFNNKIQQERSSLIDFANQKAMELQSSINGYSSNSDYCFMYNASSSGNKISQSEAENTVKTAEDKFKNDLKTFFDTKVVNLKLDSTSDIDFVINDGDKAKDVATITITIDYHTTFKTPYAGGSSESLDSSKTMAINLKEHMTRAIENPRRYRNISDI